MCLTVGTWADTRGRRLPEGAVIYVLFAEYSRIVSQYRVPIISVEDYRAMYRRWYEIDYASFPATRYFLNEDDFTEVPQTEFLEWRHRHLSSSR